MKTLYLIILTFVTTVAAAQMQPVRKTGDTAYYSGKLTIFYPDTTRPSTNLYYNYENLEWHVGLSPYLFIPDSTKKKFEGTFRDGYISSWRPFKFWYATGSIAEEVYFDSLAKHKIDNQYYSSGILRQTRIDTFYVNQQDILLEKKFYPTGKVESSTSYLHNRDKRTITKIITEYYENGQKWGETKYLQYIDNTDNSWREKLIYSKTWNEKGQLIKPK